LEASLRFLELDFLSVLLRSTCGVCCGRLGVRFRPGCALFSLPERRISELLLSLRVVPELPPVSPLEDLRRISPEGVDLPSPVEGRVTVPLSPLRRVGARRVSCPAAGVVPSVVRVRLAASPGRRS